jgi:hypothetical protein
VHQHQHQYAKHLADMAHALLHPLHLLRACTLASSASGHVNNTQQGQAGVRQLLLLTWW